jgi:glycosyltransferase involved in cell wall biosynthesis
MFSIIIPTYNRVDTLQLTLDGYLKQSAPYLIKEIIVIDDGSNELSKAENLKIIERVSDKASFPVHYLYQENMGPAKARNIGIKSAVGKLILMTGDDIVPHVNMIKEHFFSHKLYGMADNICVLGHSIWPFNFKITPFMEYINEMGLQFGYSIISDPHDVPFNFFYTSNISLNREFLTKEKLFDSDFPYAAWEDIELSYRLKKQGMRIIYSKNAIGYHHHKISFSSFRKRQEHSGYSACIFYQKHPALKQFLNIDNHIRYNTFQDIRIKILENLCIFAEKYNIDIRYNKCYDQVMGYYYQKGIKEYISEKQLFK